VAEPALARALDEQRPEDHAARSAAIAERAEPGQPGHRPVVTVVSTGSGHEAALPVEQALAGPAARRNEGRSGRVAVVPGGHRPGKPDQIQRDRARAQLPLTGHRRVVVLGCTVGAGQTMTALLTGEVLASLRSDSIAVLDLNPGAESLIKRALLRPALSQAASLGPSRLAVLGGLPPRASATSDHAVDASAALSLLDQSSARHQIVLADPSTAMVPRLLTMADQIVLVAPASAPAARAIGMTFEWLDAHGQATLAAEAIMVMNGVSRRSLPHVEQAERVCVGRCRAIVRVPWDDQLQRHPGRPAQSVPNQSGPGQPPAPHWAGLLAPATAGAYTALAGVIVASLIGHEPDRSRSAAPGEPGPARASAHGAAR
jgi:MinD-like ATPase involved in chromosome partitioning or flagellar assembly